MQENLAKVLELVGETEGGFVDSPATDPGGATNRGITQRTLTAWRLHHGGLAATVDDVRNLTPDEASAILASQYLDTIQFAKLPSGLDYAVGDCSVNSGPSRAVKILQETLGFAGVDQVDGIVGVQTLTACGARDPVELISAYSAARLVFMQGLANWAPNGKGWRARVVRVQHDAEVMLLGASALPKPSLTRVGIAKAAGKVRLLATTSGKAAVASAAGAVIAAGSAAPQAITFLQGYESIRVVHWCLVALGAAVAFSPLAVVLQRNAKGATT